MMADESFFITLLSSKKTQSLEVDNSASKFTNVLDKSININNFRVSICELFISSQLFNLNSSSSIFYVGYKNVHEKASNKVEILTRVQLNSEKSIGSVLELKKLINSSFRNSWGKMALKIINSSREKADALSSTSSWKLLNESYSMEKPNTEFDSSASSLIETFAIADSNKETNFKPKAIVKFENQLGKYFKDFF